jgi:O-antigen ligase
MQGNPFDLSRSSGGQGVPALTPPGRARLGLPFFLLLLYPVFDYGRPPNPMDIPLVISVLLAVVWIAAPAKKINLQIVCFLLLLGGMAISSVMAFNIGSARQGAESLAIILLCICIPLIHIVDSLRKVRIFVNVLIVVFVYVGTWALFSGGNGPAGSAGAQDENYTSAMMCMAIPLAYFSIPMANRRAIKFLYVMALGVFVAAVVVSSSRGGFLGLLAVALFCVFYSPRRKQALVGLAIGAFLALAVAGPTYWEEMGTITDTKEATADMRLELWTIAWRMFEHNPAFGVGPGNFRWNVGIYQSAEQLEKFGRELTYSVLVHSTYFEILSELGLVGALLFATILIRTLRDLRRIRSGADSRTAQQPISMDSQRLRYYSLAITGSLVGYLVPAAFVSFTYFSHFWLVASLAVALHEIARDMARKEQASSNPLAGIS